LLFQWKAFFDRIDKAGENAETGKSSASNVRLAHGNYLG
jgi:hypothetical protein